MAFARSRDRIERICGADLDALTLRLELLAELRRVIGFDVHAWLLTDPVTTVGAAPLSDFPHQGDLPRLIRLKYLTRTNRWSAMRAPVALLHHETGGDLARSRVWRELLGEYGVTDVASVVHRDRFGTWAFLDLWRIGGRFDQHDARYLAQLAGPVTAATRRALARTFGLPVDRTDQHGPAVLLLSSALMVQGQTPPTHEFLRTLVPPSSGRAPVPAGAFNVAAQLLAVEEGVDAHPPRARVHLAGGQWLALAAARVGGGSDIAVTIEECPTDSRVDLFSRLSGLSPREGELLGLLVGGADTRRIALEMVVSEHTVQDHLKAIFTKTATHSRRMLIAQAVGA